MAKHHLQHGDADTESIEDVEDFHVAGRYPEGEGGDCRTMGWFSLAMGQLPGFFSDVASSPSYLITGLLYPA